jgi:hypothetical protein
MCMATRLAHTVAVPPSMEISAAVNGCCELLKASKALRVTGEFLTHWVIRATFRGPRNRASPAWRPGLKIRWGLPSIQRQRRIDARRAPRRQTQRQSLAATNAARRSPPQSRISFVAPACKPRHIRPDTIRVDG